MFFNLFMPKQAVGANLIYFDLFNATGSASYLALHGVYPVVSGAGAVTGVLGVDLLLTRTSAVGTSGTAATREGTDITAATFTALNHSQVLDALITARLTPGGGATAGAILSWYSVFGEETNAGTYTPAPNLARISGVQDVPAIIIPENSGIRVIQGAVASVGNIGFNVVLDVVKK